MVAFSLVSLPKHEKPKNLSYTPSCFCDAKAILETTFSEFDDTETFPPSHHTEKLAFYTEKNVTCLGPHMLNI